MWFPITSVLETTLVFNTSVQETLIIRTTLSEDIHFNVNWLFTVVVFEKSISFLLTKLCQLLEIWSSHISWSRGEESWLVGGGVVRVIPMCG